MLVITRKTAQAVLLDERIRISIVRVRGGEVRLGIEAAPEINVRREELPPLDQEGQSDAQGIDS